MKLTHCFSIPLVSLALSLPANIVLAEIADTVLRGGSIYTVDSARSRAESVAIKGGEIVFVGSDRAVVDYIGQDTTVIELQGKMVLPGFHDSHIHPVSGMLASQTCNLRGLKGLAAYLQKIAQCDTEDPGSEWLVGTGWSYANFGDDIRPDKKQLDNITSNRPVAFTSYDGHSVWVNSRAIELSGISAETLDPPSGMIQRYPASREPSGLFVEKPAMELIYQAMPDVGNRQRFAALMEAQRYLNSLGITAIQDAWVGVDNTGVYGNIPVYQKAVRDNRLNLRVTAALYWQPDGEADQLQQMLTTRKANEKGLFRASTVKIWQDGVMHTHTAKLLEEYMDRPGDKGMSYYSQEQLNHIVTALDREGFQIHIHADGDGALRESLDAFEVALKKNGRRDSRHHIAHLELVHPGDIPRLRQLGVIANVQPMWSTSRDYVSDLIEVKLGKSRSPYMETNKRFLKNGVTVAYGSDWPVTSANPMDLIEAAVTRIRPALPLEEKRRLTPLLPGEEVTVADAIASYTINGAYANHQEDLTGSLEVGKRADIIVLDQNLFEIDPHRISDTRVTMTFFDGRLVYHRLPDH